MPNPLPEGERLAKRVAALQSCSRSEAERLIEGGWVQVDGVVADDPARRVQAEAITIAPDADTLTLEPVTLLWHKPVGVTLHPDQALASLVPPSGDLRPWHLKHLRCVSPMPAESSGLAVFAQSPGVLRKLREDGLLLEHEWMLDLNGSIHPAALEALRQHTSALSCCPRDPALKLSVSSQSADRTRLRLAIKTYAPEGLSHWIEQAHVPAASLHRLRLGRIALGPLAPQEWRLLRTHERF